MDPEDEGGDYEAEEEGEGEEDMNAQEFVDYLNEKFEDVDEEGTKMCDWTQFYNVFSQLTDETPQDQCEDIYRTILIQQLGTEELTQEDLNAGFNYEELVNTLQKHCNDNAELDNQDIFDLICNGGEMAPDEGDEQEYDEEYQLDGEGEVPLEGYDEVEEVVVDPDNQEDVVEPVEAEEAYVAAEDVEYKEEAETAQVYQDAEDDYEDGADYNAAECPTPKSEEPIEPAPEIVEEALPVEAEVQQEPKPVEQEPKPPTPVKRQLSSESKGTLGQIRAQMKTQMAQKRECDKLAPVEETPAEEAPKIEEARPATPPPKPGTPPPEEPAVPEPTPPEPVTTTKALNPEPEAPVEVPKEPPAPVPDISSAELEALRKRVGELEADLAAAQTANTEQERKLEEVEQNVRKGERETLSWRQLYEQLQKSRAADVGKLEKSILDKDEEAKKADEELKKLREELETVQSHDGNERATIVALQAENTALRGSSEGQQSENTEIKAEMARVNKELEDVTDDRERLRLESYQLATGDTEDLTERLTTLEEDNIRLKEANEELEEAFNIQFEKIRGIQSSLTETAEEEGITADDIRLIVERQVEMLGAQAQPGDLTNTLNALREEFTGLYEREIKHGESTISANLQAAHEGLSDDEDDEVFTKMMATATHQLVLDKIEDETGLAEIFEKDGIIHDVIGFTFGPEFVKEDELVEAARNVEHSRHVLESITNKLSQDTVQNEELLLMNRTLMKEVYASIGDESASKAAGDDMADQVGVYKKQFQDAQVELKNAMDVIVQQKVKLDQQQKLMEESTARLKKNAQEEMDRVTGEQSKQHKRQCKELTLQLQNSEAKRLQVVQETNLKVEKMEAELETKRNRCEELEMDSQNYSHLKPLHEKLEEKHRETTEKLEETEKELSKTQAECKQLNGKNNELESSVADFEARQAAVDVAIEEGKSPVTSVDGKALRVCVVGGNDGGLIAASRLKDLKFDVTLFHAADTVSPTDDSISVPEDVIKYKHSVIRIERASQGWLVTYLDSTEEQRVQRTTIFKGIVTGAGMFLPPAREKVHTEDKAVQVVPETTNQCWQVCPETAHIGVETERVNKENKASQVQPESTQAGCQAQPETHDIGIMPDPPETEAEPERVLKSELDDVQGRYDELKERHSEAATTITGLEDKLEEVQAERDGLTEERGDLERENEELSNEIVEIQAQLTKIKKKLAASGAALADAEANSGAQSDKISSQNSQLNAEKSELEARIAEAEKELALEREKLDRERGNLAGDVERLQAEKQELEDQAQTLAKEKADLQTQVEDAQAMADDLSDSSARLERDLEAANVEKAQLKKNLDALNASIAEAGGGADAALLAANTQLQDQCTKLREDMEQERNQAGQLQDANLRLEKLNEKLKQKVESLKNETRGGSQGSADSNERRQSLIGEIEKASKKREGELKKSQEQLALVETENETLARECDKLKKQLLAQGDELSKELIEKNEELTERVKVLEAQLTQARSVSPPPEAVQEATQNIDEAYSDALEAVKAAEANEKGSGGASDVEGCLLKIDEKDAVITDLKDKVIDLSEKLKVVSNGLRVATKQAEDFYAQVEPRMALMQEKADTAGRNVTRIERQVENLKATRGPGSEGEAVAGPPPDDVEVRELVDENKKLQRELEAARRKMAFIEKSRDFRSGEKPPGNEPVSPASSTSSGGRASPPLKRILDFKRDLSPETAKILMSKKPMTQQKLKTLKERFLRLHKECQSPRRKDFRGRHH